MDRISPLAVSLAGALLLLAPGAAQAFTVEEVHFAEPSAGLSEYVA
jgi:hypothetical protein